MINRALQQKPDAGTHWSTRTLGQAEGVGKSTVQPQISADQTDSEAEVGRQIPGPTDPQPAPFPMGTPQSSPLPYQAALLLAKILNTDTCRHLEQTCRLRDATDRRELDGFDLDR